VKIGGCVFHLAAGSCLRGVEEDATQRNTHIIMCVDIDIFMYMLTMYLCSIRQVAPDVAFFNSRPVLADVESKKMRELKDIYI